MCAGSRRQGVSGGSRSRCSAVQRSRTGPAGARSTMPPSPGGSTANSVAAQTASAQAGSAAASALAAVTRRRPLASRVRRARWRRCRPAGRAAAGGAAPAARRVRGARRQRRRSPSSAASARAARISVSSPRSPSVPSAMHSCAARSSAASGTSPSGRCLRARDDALAHALVFALCHAATKACRLASRRRRGGLHHLDALRAGRRACAPPPAGRSDRAAAGAVRLLRGCRCPPARSAPGGARSGLRARPRSRPRRQRRSAGRRDGLRAG